MNNFMMYLEQELKIKLFENEVYELKKQLEALKSTNKVLSEELTKDKILKQDCLTTCCGIPIGDIPKLVNQQKEFIEYLSNLSNWYSADGVKQGIVNEILSKCKEIMGTDINVGTKGGE